MCRSKRRLTRQWPESKGGRLILSKRANCVRLLVVGMPLVILCSCIHQKNDFTVRTPQQVQTFQQLDTDYEHLLGRAKKDVLVDFGFPQEQNRYRLHGIERERYVYYFIDAKDHTKKVLEIYFIDDAVHGFNVFRADRYEEMQGKPMVGRQCVVAGL